MSPSLWSAVDLRAGQQPAAMLGELSSKQTASLQVLGTEPGTPRSGEKTFWRGVPWTKPLPVESKWEDGEF